MPAYRTRRVEAILSSRRGLQRVLLDDASRAYVLTQLVGPVAAGDRVVVNTTAVDLRLGTGGWHVVHWNLERDSYDEAGSGHILKLRYTSLQVDVGAAEEHRPLTIDDLGGAPVVACGLHSQLPAVAVAFHAASAVPRRLVYVMTDGAALPLALSDLVHDLQERRLIAGTVTAGQAFGGDFEAVNVHDGLLVARDHAAADAIVAGIGPGVVGTGTKFGHTGLDVVGIVDAAAALRGIPIVAVRFSESDRRERHRGPSHHTMTAVELAARRLLVPDPDELDVPDVGALLSAHGLVVTTMGRSPADDPAFFQWAGAAGVAAARVLDAGNVERT